MSNGMFDNFGTEHLEEKARDFVGFQPIETDLYLPVIKLAYVSRADSGVMSIVFDFDIGGKTFKSEQYISNKEGKNYFMTKPKQGDPKRAPLPGFTVVDDICNFATGKGLKSQPTEEKTIKLYNFEQKKDLPTPVQVLTDLIGKKVGIAVWKTQEYKKVKQDGAYVNTSEEVSRNEIEKAVHPDTAATMEETAEKKDVKWASGWVARNKGKTKDKRKGDRGGPPQAGNSGGSGAAKPSLFGGAS